MSLLTKLMGPQRLLRPSGGCHSCPLKRVGFVPALHPPGAEVIFVGTAPTEADVTNGEVFTGIPGQKLREQLAEAGVKNYAMTNLTHCRGSDGKAPNTKTINACLSQFILEEIADYPVVVLLGGVPLRAFFPGARSKNHRGNFTVHPDYPGKRFYNLHDPGYISRNLHLEPEFRKHINRLGRYLSLPEEREPSCRIVREEDPDFGTELDRALSHKLISLDIETDGLESWTMAKSVKSLALTADGETVIFASAEDTSWIGVLEQLKTFLEDRSKSVVGHNIGFDLDFLEREEGIRLRCDLASIFDTQTVWYEVGQYKEPSLKELVAAELDGYRTLLYQPREDTWGLDLLGKYNAEDVIYPLQLLKKGWAKAQPTTRDLLSRVLGPASLIFRRIQTNGFYIRRGYWEEKRDEYQKKTDALLAEWSAHDPAFDPRQHTSGKGLERYLFEIRQFPILKRTGKSQAPATDASALKELAREYPDHAKPLEFLLELRRLEKIRSTYLDAYEKFMVGGDDRLHPSFILTHTDTGRTSSRTPNVQNIPRDREIRDLFGAPPGRVLMEHDFSQIEFRIMVCLAQDPAGIEAYRSGLDAHTMTARSFMAGSEPTKAERSQAKVVNFSLLYGGDAYKVAQWARDAYGLDWTERQSQPFVDAFFRTYRALPGFHKWSDQDLLKNQGWFRSVTGHVYYYDGWDHPNQGQKDHVLRAALNSRCQGPAAHICFLTMIHADRMLRERGFTDRDFMMTNSVHDSILLECEERHVQPITRTLRAATQETYKWVRDWMVVPLVLDSEYGLSWGSMTGYDPEAD